MWSYPQNTIITYNTPIITECIKNNRPIVFIKLGDGEFSCANRWPGHNCDHDNNTRAKGDGIINSVRYLTSNSINVHFGLWPDSGKQAFWERLSTKPIPWTHYHSILIDKRDILEQSTTLHDKITLFKTIKESPLKKIFICNELLVKAKQLLNIDSMIYIPLKNWFDTELGRIIQEAQSNIDQNGTITLIACGMGGKVLITELVKLFPKGIFLDIGSGLDFLCTQRDSRGHGYSYEELKTAFKDLLPADWDDEKYNSIITQARGALGIHLPK